MTKSSSRVDLVGFLDNQLNIRAISDSSMNGVQIEGSDSVTRVAVAVDAGLSVIEAAVQANANFLIVHHGLFWGSASPIVGPLKKLMHAALAHGLTLYAAHLPLDAHEVWGNNFVLVKMLGLREPVAAIPYQGTKIACIAKNPDRLPLAKLEETLGKLPGARTPLLCLPFGPKVPDSVCVVTGSGSDALWQAAEAGFDTLITGEPRQSVFHFAKENHLNVIFGGHYATETIGVCEVAKAIEAKFGIPWTFIDQPTGI